MSSGDHTLISIVLPCYNEADSLPSFRESLIYVLKGMSGIDWELIWVDDGSTDETSRLIGEMIDRETGSRIQSVFIRLSRNFGHEAAMIAGIDAANGEAVVCMDTDGQHPPGMIPEIISAWRKGFQVVTMKRSARHDQWGQNRMSGLFYTFLNQLSDFRFDKNASDFFLISAPVITILKNHFRERNRFLRGYIQVIGFDRVTLSFDAPPRLAGKSKYNYRKLLRLAGVAVFSFSNRPLKFALYTSVIFALFTMAVGIYSLLEFLFGETPPSGYTTLIIFLSICFTMVFLLIGVLSVYFGKGLDEIRQRPLYIVRNLRRKKTSQEGGKSTDQ
ncbi:MAG: glycosyltransferase family 2 protein [Bacteroidales bacterium]|nr:glycosyltransferase family 2 protein [Bacteroidales bacterium]